MRGRRKRLGPRRCNEESVLTSHVSSGRAHAGVACAASCLELASLGEGPGSVSTASVCSAFSYLDGEAEDIQADEFERRLDALFEKRSVQACRGQFTVAFPLSTAMHLLNVTEALQGKRRWSLWL
jgi:hypothetical protein